MRSEHVGKNLRVDADLIAAAAAVDEDVVELENRILNVDGHLLFRAEGRGAAHKVAGIPLRLFGLAGRNVLYADLAGENDERLLVLILHHEGLDDVVMVKPAGGSGKRRAAVLDVFVRLFFKGDLVFLEPLRRGRKALVLRL